MDKKSITKPQSSTDLYAQKHYIIDSDAIVPPLPAINRLAEILTRETHANEKTYSDKNVLLQPLKKNL